MLDLHRMPVWHPLWIVIVIVIVRHSLVLMHPRAGNWVRKPIGAELEREEPAWRRHEPAGHERAKRKRRERECGDQLPSHESGLRRSICP